MMLQTFLASKVEISHVLKSIANNWSILRKMHGFHKIWIWKVGEPLFSTAVSYHGMLYFGLQKGDALHIGIIETMDPNTIHESWINMVTWGNNLTEIPFMDPNTIHELWIMN